MQAFRTLSRALPEARRLSCGISYTLRECTAPLLMLVQNVVVCKSVAQNGLQSSHG